MRTVNDKCRRYGGSKFRQRFYDLRLCRMMLRHISRAHYCQSHTAGKVPGIKNRNILKGFRRFKGILIALADMLCHRDMYHVLSLC